MKLSKYIVEKPWGCFDLPFGFDNPQRKQIGEIWYDHVAQKLPILVKWLFTSEKLSVQVHPNDKQARQYGLTSGKEECWLIVDAAPNAVLGMGTNRVLDADELRNLALSGEIEDVIDWRPVKAGDYFYIPAGTVHAIGAGVTLIEVQQNADITYRLYDYGRPRELHLDKAVAVSDAKPYDDIRCGNIAGVSYKQIVSGPFFDLHYCQGSDNAKPIMNGKDSWIIPINGTVLIGENTAQVGDCIYAKLDKDNPIKSDSNFLIAQNID